MACGARVTSPSLRSVLTQIGCINSNLDVLTTLFVFTCAEKKKLKNAELVTRASHAMPWKQHLFDSGRLYNSCFIKQIKCQLF